VRLSCLLFTVAYEMLGSAADAEDVLQETWLRWVGADLDTVENQRPGPDCQRRPNFDPLAATEF